MRIFGVFGLVCLLMLAPGFISGCQPKQQASNEPAIDYRTWVYVDDLVADCLARCERGGAYGQLTHNGCVYACEEVGQTFRLRDRVYPNWQRCEEAVRGIEENAFLRDYDEMCMTYTDNIHRQRGCLDGVRFYYELLNPAAVCRPYATMAAPGLQGRSLSQ